MNRGSNIIEIERQITKLIFNERRLSIEEIAELESNIDKVKPFDFKPLLRRVFDIPTNFRLKESQADQGLLGILNRMIRTKRCIKYNCNFCYNVL